MNWYRRERGNRERWAKSPGRQTGETRKRDMPRRLGPG